MSGLPGVRRIGVRPEGATSVTADSPAGRGGRSPEPPREPVRPHLTVSGGTGPLRWRSTVQIGDSWVLVGELTTDEILHFRQLVNGNLYAWDDPLEVWVPTPSLLFRLVHHGAPDLSSLDGFRQLGQFRPLAEPDLDDTRLWKRTSLASLAETGVGFGVRREDGIVYWLLPLERWGFFKVTPLELISVEPGLFGALGVDRLIDFLRGSLPTQGGTSPKESPPTGEERESGLLPSSPERDATEVSPTEPLPSGSPTTEDVPLVPLAVDWPRSVFEERGALDLRFDLGARDLQEDGGRRDLRKDLGMQDRLRDLGARESFRLGAALTGQLPDEIQLAISSGRSSGFTVPRRRS